MHPGQEHDGYESEDGRARRGLLLKDNIHEYAEYPFMPHCIAAELILLFAITQKFKFPSLPSTVKRARARRCLFLSFYSCLDLSRAALFVHFI